MNEGVLIPATFAVAGGELRIRGWPRDLPPPFGLRATADGLAGLPRLRGAARQALAAAGHPVLDPLEWPPQALPAPPLAALEAGLLHAWQHGSTRGVLVGLDDDARHHLAVAAAAAVGQAGLVLASDTAAAHRWQRAMQELAPGACTVRAATECAAEPASLRHQDLLLVDAVELHPWPRLSRLLDQSPARHRLGFLARPDPHLLLRLGPGLGPLAGRIANNTPPRTIELRVDLPPTAAADHAEAWHTFLGAFDRFVALRPGSGFGTFVQEARQEPAWRPALLAWHRALRCAAWHEHKAALLAELVARHRHQRILVFTPDRAVAYAIARQHLIAPLTAELPRAERRAVLDAFAAGELRGLVGPRLLDLGVAAGSADIGIVVGGGLGSAQRHAQRSRVHPAGIVYELVSNDTLEVGRARRWQDPTAEPPPALHDQRR